jgi:hypothetical protein
MRSEDGEDDGNEEDANLRKKARIGDTQELAGCPQSATSQVIFELPESTDDEEVTAAQGESKVDEQGEDEENDEKEFEKENCENSQDTDRFETHTQRKKQLDGHLSTLEVPKSTDDKGKVDEQGEDEEEETGTNTEKELEEEKRKDPQEAERSGKQKQLESHLSMETEEGLAQVLGLEPLNETLQLRLGEPEVEHFVSDIYISQSNGTHSKEGDGGNRERTRGFT